MSNTYPAAKDNVVAYRENPAIQIFGNRFFTDQTTLELLHELLLILFSPKKFDDTSVQECLPSYAVLRGGAPDNVAYYPKARLNLKLFSFLGASRLDTRHKTHRDHHQQLLERLKQNISTSEVFSREEVVVTLENLLLGFQGAGTGRTWCAQSFLPLAPAFLAGETIWKKTKANTKREGGWFDYLEYFEGNQRLFLAHGGELLYLQICNALRQDQSLIKAWLEEIKLGFDQESDPETLHAQLVRALPALMGYCPQTLNKIAEFIDTGLDEETGLATDYVSGNLQRPRKIEAGWCPGESWQEGHLFAVELLRLATATLDIIDRFALIELLCAVQVLRSLLFQSARYSNPEGTIPPENWPGFRLAVSDPDESKPAVKRISRQTVKMAEKLIHQAVRSDKIQLGPKNGKTRTDLEKIADKGYGSKLFIGLAKKIGFIIPKRGAGARFVMDKSLLRLLVVTTVPLGGQLTYDTFKALVEIRFGLVFDAEGFKRASQWAGIPVDFLPSDTDHWLLRMLDASGMLYHLSDSCALVKNPCSKEATNEAQK